MVAHHEQAICPPASDALAEATDDAFKKLEFITAWHQYKAEQAGFRNKVTVSQAIRFMVEDCFEAACAELKKDGGADV